MAEERPKNAPLAASRLRDPAVERKYPPPDRFAAFRPHALVMSYGPQYEEFNHPARPAIQTKDRPYLDSMPASLPLYEREYGVYKTPAFCLASALVHEYGPEHHYDFLPTQN